MIHHNDCAYCIHARHKPGKKMRKIKNSKVPYMLPWCEIHDREIVAGFFRAPGRFCDHYQQENCLCEACNLPKDVISVKQSVNILDIWSQ